MAESGPESIPSDDDLREWSARNAANAHVTTLALGGKLDTPPARFSTASMGRPENSAVKYVILEVPIEEDGTHTPPQPIFCVVCGQKSIEFAEFGRPKSDPPFVVYRSRMCPCQRILMEQAERAEAEAAQAREADAIHKAIVANKNASGIVGRLDWYKMRFQSYRADRSPSQRAAYNQMISFVRYVRKNGSTQGLENVILGSECNGTGKTHLSLATAHALLDFGLSVKVYRVSRLIDAVRAENDPNRKDKGTILRELLAADLLVLDELCNERVSTDYTREFLADLVDERIGTGLPMIITTNKRNLRELGEHVGGAHGNAIASRLLGSSVWLSVDGPDGRGIQAAERQGGDNGNGAL